MERGDLGVRPYRKRSCKGAILQPSSAVELIRPCGEDEVVFVEAVDFVRPDGDFGLSPAEGDIGMVADFLRQGADFAHKIEGLREVFEFEGFFKVVLIDDLPAGGKQRRKSRKSVAFERRNAALTGDTFLS